MRDMGLSTLVSTGQDGPLWVGPLLPHGVYHFSIVTIWYLAKRATDLLGRKNTILDCAVERGRDAVPAPESRWRLRYNNGRDGARGKIGRGHIEKRQDGEDDYRSCF